MQTAAIRLLEKVRALPLTPDGDSRLSAMLRHDARHFRGLSTGDAEWVRGHLLAAFEKRGTPGVALRSIREELQTSLSPIVLAGAARALRSVGKLDGELRDLLAAAAERIHARDERVAFEGTERSQPAMTAAQEIAATLAQELGAASACCCHAPALQLPAEREEPSLYLGGLGKVMIEDQSGARSSLVETLQGRTSLVALFYTRCMNPAKCSLTITRLAAIGRHAAGDDPLPDVNLLAMTYDGGHDTPARLRRYGEDRGFSFGENARFIRCLSGWSAVARALRLRVGYGTSTVNEHARELFLVSSALFATLIDIELLGRRDVLAQRIRSM